MKPNEASKRTETKFILGLAQYEVLRARLHLQMTPDAHAGTKGRYPIFSAYYDTPDLRFFYQKINGEFRHTKLRLRNYSTVLWDGKPGFLEIKEKYCEGQEKVRIPIHCTRTMASPNAWAGNIAGDGSSPSLNRVLALASGLIHVGSVYYEREAYQLIHPEAGNLRVNFDSNLAYLPPSIDRIDHDTLMENALGAHNEVICEVKSDTGVTPGFLKQELQYIGADQTRVSKYAEALLSASARATGAKGPILDEVIT